MAEENMVEKPKFTDSKVRGDKIWKAIALIVVAGAVFGYIGYWYGNGKTTETTDSGNVCPVTSATTTPRPSATATTSARTSTTSTATTSATTTATTETSATATSTATNSTLY